MGAMVTKCIDKMFHKKIAKAYIQHKECNTATSLFFFLLFSSSSQIKISMTDKLVDLLKKHWILGALFFEM
jgi:hypothetical protein